MADARSPSPPSSPPRPATCEQSRRLSKRACKRTAQPAGPSPCWSLPLGGGRVPQLQTALRQFGRYEEAELCEAAARGSGIFKGCQWPLRRVSRAPSPARCRPRQCRVRCTVAECQNSHIDRLAQIGLFSANNGRRQGPLGGSQDNDRPLPSFLAPSGGGDGRLPPPGGAHESSRGRSEVDSPPRGANDSGRRPGGTLTPPA